MVLQNNFLFLQDLATFIFSASNSFTYVAVWLPSCVQLCNPMAYQASLSLSISRSLPKSMSIALVMPSSCLILWCPLLLLHSIFHVSVQFSWSVMSNSLRPHGLQHARFPCPSPSPGACSNSCPLSRWHHSTISSSVVPFSSCPQSFPASGSFLMSQLFTSGGQCIRTSASVFPMNIQDLWPLGWTSWISL